MNHVLRPYLRKCVVVFLDDILIFSQRWEEHLIHLQAVLQALRDHELYCKPSKCVIGSSDVLYSKKILSAKNFFKSDLQAVRQEFIFVKRRVARFVFGRSVRLLIVYLHIHDSF